MPRGKPDGSRAIAAWRVNNRATTYLVEHLPAAIWSSPVPGVPRTTVRKIAAHLHNSRCRWIRSLGAADGVRVPRLVDLDRVRQRELIAALERSSDGMVELIERAEAKGGRLARPKWMNFPADLEHFLSYFAAHEGHHRGQLLLIARQLGHRLPLKIASGVWQWSTHARELDDRRSKG